VTRAAGVGVRLETSGVTPRERSFGTPMSDDVAHREAVC
jgi:hypothetical protein